MNVVDRADLSRRRARAGRIREGMKSYIHTLGEIAAAYAERDWQVLGYETWDAYVKEEFGASRLGLPAEQRQKAVVELRMAGLSLREIGSAVNVNARTVRRDLDDQAAADAGDLRPVYFIQAFTGGLIKIGVAADVTACLAEIQRMCPIPLTILATVPAAGQLGERALHQRFAPFRRHGEWFEPSPDLLAYIEASAKPGEVATGWGPAEDGAASPSSPSAT